MRMLIYGSKEFAMTVAELIRHCGFELAGMVDDYTAGPGIVGTLDQVMHTYPPSDYGFAIAIGYSNIQARWQAWKRVHALGYRAPILVHPRAYVADTALIGEGSMIMAGAIIDVRAHIGELSVVWPGACINHDAKVGKNTFISPNATICGFVSIGAHCFIGASASIADHCVVPDASFVKMLTRYTAAPK